MINHLSGVLLSHPWGAVHCGISGMSDRECGVAQKLEPYGLEQE
jgi:hypothetical protein